MKISKTRFEDNNFNHQCAPSKHKDETVLASNAKLSHTSFVYLDGQLIHLHSAEAAANQEAQLMTTIIELDDHTSAAAFAL